MSEGNSWKLQDAKARFSELVRRARQGEPQQVTVHGKQAVIVIDPERFEIRPKVPREKTLQASSKDPRNIEVRQRKFDLSTSWE